MMDTHYTITAKSDETLCGLVKRWVLIETEYTTRRELVTCPDCLELLDKQAKVTKRLRGGISQARGK